ncbi:endo alpha-1,4 polygalactosaminidase [Paracrocinitomix mangrovi]|uniref:endo alpha-1,4 polygalactosaminidase n=1 Tax=Paracrocinitomix mangrovi TaxID=2862509 RepID=UPI001EDA9B4D|nr:endo alpha-1,4 polygalactosaminidase [Paracrocinitomix mangrovi]UKN02735.1 endo alpha-1,4 polygalactosaminidase [Paracrocinitomix mangrovi]
MMKNSVSTKLFKYLSICCAGLLGFANLSCKKDSEVKPEGNSQAIAVYNQAYCENYEADNIDDIIQEAKNAYVLVDPFADGVVEKIPQIKTNNNQVGGYISIGTGENWRDDFNAMQPYLVSKQWGEWDGEYFVKETTTGIIEIMKARIDKLADWGCDWVEFDNMDWFFDEESNDTYGINVTEAEGIAYYNELCDYAHSKGLKCMAKNHVVQAVNFDGVLYESYNKEKDWWDHAGAQSFLDSGKLVIINHYHEKQPNLVYSEYMDLYNSGISYICESSKEKKYIHYNQ